MWREMYDRVRRPRTKTTQPGHFPAASERITWSDETRAAFPDDHWLEEPPPLVSNDPTEIEHWQGVIPPYDVPPCDEDPEQPDFDDVVAGVSIPESVVGTLMEALDWYEDDRMECDRIEGREHDDEDHYGIQAARKALQG